MTCSLGRYFFISFVLLGLSASPSWADETEEFLEMYAEESKVLRDYYSNATIIADVTISSPASKYESIYYGAGTRFRLDEQGAVTENRESLVSAPGATFIAENNSQTNAYSYQTSGIGTELQKELLESIRLRRFPLAPVTLLELDIYDFLASKAGLTVSIDRITNRTDDKHAILCVEYSYTTPDDNDLINGTIEFLSDDHYALSSYTWGAAKAKPAALVCQISYDGKDENTGVPLTKKVEFFTKDKAGERSQEEIYEISSLVPGPADASLFTPEHFGLPELDISSPFNYRPWFVIAGLLVISFAVFRVIRKRAE